MAIDRFDDREWSEKNKFRKEELIIPKETIIDLSQGWDNESFLEEFRKAIKQQPWYKPGLLYCGYDGLSGSYTSPDGGIWCYTEKAFDKFEESPLQYAFMYDVPAVAVYDPEKMKASFGFERYVMTAKDAIVAILKFKF
ncbi:hypothetical protein D6827_03480 [Candidatus Parcubacteria bacterium]|nr:MAG: hypothetical protein D6827_03480 [Candidatus Parcubacteria bacterium]